MRKLSQLLKSPASKFISVFIAGMLVGGLYVNFRARQSAAIALADWTARIESVNKVNAKLVAETQSILSANAALKAQNEALEASRATIAAQLTQTQGDLAYLQAHEPAQPELETQPLVINLRLQIKKGNEMFSLAIADREKADALIANQKVEIKGLEQAFHNAMEMYTNEHELVSGATVKIARLARQNKTVKTVAKAEGIVIVILAVINLVK